MSWEEPTATETKQNAGPAQIGTVIFVMLTLLVGFCYLTIFLNPQIFFNPFKPPSVDMPAATPIGQGGATPTLLPTWTPPKTYPPTWTPTPTPTTTPTFTPKPTWTPLPPTATPKPLPPWTVSKPIYTDQKLYPSASDWWSGVAGEVTNRNGEPVTDVVVRVWDDRGNVWEVRPGEADKYAYQYGSAHGGKGTYAWWEQVLKSSCQVSEPVHVQLFKDGQPITGVVDVKTTGDCERNLILVHFRKNY